MGTVVNGRRILLAALLACLATATAAASPSALKNAAELLETHHYESSAALLRATQFEGDMAPMAALTLARVYARNAELHRALHASSLTLGLRYLQQLASQRDQDRSRYATLYYGEYLLEAHRTSDSAAQIRRFLEQESNASPYTEIARVLLATGVAATRDVQVKYIDPLVRLQAATALSKAPARRTDALALADQAVDALRKSASVLPMRAVSHAVGVYARAAQHDKAFAMIATSDMGRPSLDETVGASKELRHYDPALLGNLALLYGGAAEELFERARLAPRVRSIASYFLAELQLSGGRTSTAAALLAKIANARDLPSAFRERATILRAIAELQGTDGARGEAALDILAKKHAQDPTLLAETLLACVHAQGRCAAVASAARALAETAQSERFRALHRAVGEQYALEGKNDLALQALETARDKSNKNKIDTNDPLLLLRLAEQHFAAKNFSESLEIYFELGKEFPAVRQLQEAAQGIYSTQYRSAGDVRIF